MNESTTAAELRREIAVLDDELRLIAERGDPAEQAEFDSKMTARRALADTAEKHDRIAQAAQNPAQVERLGGPTLLRQGPSNPWNESGRPADMARYAAERMDGVGDATRGRIIEVIESDHGSLTSPAAHWALATSSPAYRSAFTKMLRDPMNGHRMFDAEELDAFRHAEQVRAMVVGTNTGGGFMVPTHLDPAILLTNNGSVNVIRQISRVVTLTAGNVWNGVTSAGVTASWDGELVEVSDDSPSVDRVSIPVYKAQAFVAASLEAVEDTNIEAEVAGLFADARDRLEAAAHATGSGSSQPTGIFTALEANTTIQLVSTTAATIGVVDLDTTYRALPIRFRPRATWLMNPTYGLAVKNLGRAVSASFTATLTDPPATFIHERPVVYSDAAPSTQTTTAKDPEIIFGDFSNYVIVDRIGATMEYVPHVFGANGRPIGERGWFTHWRTGADSVLDAAFRLLVDKTSA